VALLIDHLIRNSEKIAYLPEVNHLDQPSCIKDDDATIVKASIQTRAILVTDDGPLLQCIHDENLAEKFSLKAMRPREAIRHSYPSVE
jgi:hypothetical protein